MFEKGWKRDATKASKPLGQWTQKRDEAKSNYENEVDEEDE
jgi:hypothetical protein